MVFACMQDEILRRAVQRFKGKNWKKIGSVIYFVYHIVKLLIAFFVLWLVLRLVMKQLKCCNCESF